jgi:drug/metabolite transporter (DMT)-like permease
MICNYCDVVIRKIFRKFVVLLNRQKDFVLKSAALEFCYIFFLLIVLPFSPFVLIHDSFVYLLFLILCCICSAVIIYYVYYICKEMTYYKLQ